jgi:hypothetical protein
VCLEEAVAVDKTSQITCSTQASKAGEDVWKDRLDPDVKVLISISIQWSRLVLAEGSHFKKVWEHKAPKLFRKLSPAK